MIKAILVEDEPRSRELLAELLKKNCPQVQAIDTAANVQQAVKAIEKGKPDLVFLDISMPDGTGFDILEKISPAFFDIIFTTATDQHAIKAIKYSALDYLLKPIDTDELKKAVERLEHKKSQLNTVENLTNLLQNLKQANNDTYQKLTIPTGQAYEIIYIKDIIRCEANGSYANFILTDGRRLTVTANLKYYEDILPSNEFVRIHHHHLINIKHVVRVLKNDGGFVVMSDGMEIEIARRKKDEIMDMLKRV